MAVTVSLTPAVLDAYGEAEVRFVVATGLRNDKQWPEADAGLAELEQLVAAGEWRPHDEDGPRVGSWHEAYRRFGTNPRRMRPSVDALGRRLVRTGRLPRINGAVDAYNLVSVRHGLPAGAFDLGQVDGPVLIRFAVTGDRFVPLGEPDEVEQPRPGEVVYAAGEQVLTRHWNHRDCDATKLTPDSAAAAFVLERASAAVPGEVLAAAQEELTGLLRPHAAAVATATIDAGKPTATVLP